MKNRLLKKKNKDDKNKFCLQSESILNFVYFRNLKNLANLFPMNLERRKINNLLLFINGVSKILIDLLTIKGAM